MFQEGFAKFDVCPRGLCERPVIQATVDGMKTYLSTRAVPLRHAAVLSKYERQVFNLWVGQTQLHVTPWHYADGRPRRGRLYSRHICGAWN